MELEVFLVRISHESNAELGVLSFTKPNGFSWACKTLELPDKNNAPRISCIPKGRYLCEYTRSPLFSKNALDRWLKANPSKTELDAPDEAKNVFTYEIKNVVNRGGIRIHSANYTSQLLGCVALGDLHKDINADGTTDILHSGATCKAFEDLMERKPFYINIS